MKAIKQAMIFDSDRLNNQQDNTQFFKNSRKFQSHQNSMRKFYY